MDNKRLVPVMLLFLAIMVGWVLLQGYLYEKYPGLRESQVANNTPAATQSTISAPSVSTPVGGTAPTTAPTISAGLSAQGDPTQAMPQTVLLGSATANDPTYTMGLLLSTRGAGVDAVTLNRFKQLIDSDARYVYQTPSATGADASRVLAARSITVNGQAFDLSTLNWKLESQSQNSAVFSANIVSAGTPVVRITKTYTLPQASDASGGYDIKVEHAVTNLSAAPCDVTLSSNGTVTPPPELERPPERNIFHGYLIAQSRQINLQHTPIENLTAAKPNIDITHNGDKPEPLTWFGTVGAYFNALVRSEPENFSSAHARVLNPSEPKASLHDVLTYFDFAPKTIAPGTTQAYPVQVYFGPKKRDLLETPYYANYPVDYDQTLVTSFWLCAICTWQWLISLLVMLLNFFHAIVRDWGVAIIVLTLCVRALLHPVTRKAQANMYKMQKLSPQLERIKNKYKDDKEGMQRAMMQFYKEQGATPIMGCLPMMLQTPIWIALYAGLQSTFDLRHQPFLYGLTWIKDLAKPDHLLTLREPFDLFGMIHVSGLHVIPFLLAVVFYFQFKLQPKPPVQTEEQIQQQKIMQWMTLLFPVFLYPAPAGLNIYILSSTTFGMIESKFIRDALKRKDEQNPNVDNVIDVVSPTPSYSPKSKKKEEPKGFMARMAAKLEEVQRQAEEVRRQQDRKKK